MDRSLLEDALKQKVILTTPTSFVALLRAVAYGWRQESLAANAEHIREVGEELYGRLATFSEHLMKLGRSLNGSGGRLQQDRRLVRSQAAAGGTQVFRNGRGRRQGAGRA